MKQFNTVVSAVTKTDFTSEAGRGKRKIATCSLWWVGRLCNMLVETLCKGIHTWSKRSNRKKIGNVRTNVENSPTLTKRAVPAIVEADSRARAQETLRRNRLRRPDIVKSKYLLRGLMKCCHCGLTYVGQ